MKFNIFSKIENQVLTKSFFETIIKIQGSKIETKGEKQ